MRFIPILFKHGSHEKYNHAVIMSVLNERIGEIESSTAWIIESRDYLSHNLHFISNVIEDFVTECKLSMGRDIHSSVPIAYLSSLYLLCRVFRPRTVVETGVGSGLSAYMILESMKRSGHGTLHSIDVDREILLPNKSIMGDDVYHKYPNWKIHYGNSISMIPLLMSREDTAIIDMFIHDSDYSYQTQSSELYLAKKWVKKQGVIIANRPDHNRYSALKEQFSSIPLLEWETLLIPSMLFDKKKYFAIMKRIDQPVIIQ